MATLLVGVFYWWNDQPQVQVHLPEEGSPPAIYSNMTGDNLQQTFLAAIKKAERSILLIIYALTDNEIIQALKAKSEEGVSIHVVYDAKASLGIDRKLGSKVEAYPRATEGLMHQKILVLDESEVWLGSANFTPDSLNSQPNLVAAMQCKALAKVIVDKAHGMSESAYETPCKDQHFTIGGQKVELWFLPDTNKLAAERILELINSAKKTIRVGMFTFTRSDFAQALIKAKKRGINVEVFLDHYSSKGASSKIAALLKSQKIAVYTNPGQSLLHYKFLLIDDAILVNGSANWTQAAFKQNDDCFIILHPLTTDQKDQLIKLTHFLKDHMVSLKLALFGNGNMGKAVKETALEKGHAVAETLASADLCIDFTHSSVIMQHIELAAKAKKNIVIGTTGWEDHIPEAKKIASEAQIGMLYAPNFSIGLHLYLKALQQTVRLFSTQPDYDVAGLEIHHKEKADAPSGTAKALASLLQEAYQKECPFSSVRVGHVHGTHTVIFDSAFDSVTLTHSAKGRKGFATGAIKAAEWLHGKKGFYTLESIL